MSLHPRKIRRSLRFFFCISGYSNESSISSMWALLGFGLAAVLCFAVPVAQTAVQDWVRHSGYTTSGSASVMAGISMVWSVLRAVTYAFLLIAVFAGRSTSSPVSRPFDSDKNTYQA